MKPATTRNGNQMVVTLPRWLLLPLRAGLRLAARCWPAAAVATFTWLLTHMPRRRLSPRAQAFLATAERLAFDCGDVTLAGYGFGAGPTVLLVHGLQGSAANFHAMAPALAAAGFRVVAFDAVNHGNSPAGTAFSQRTVAHLRHVLAQLGHVHALVCHSAGAYVAMLALLDLPRHCRVGRCVYLAPYPDIATTLSAFTDYLHVPASLHPPLQRWFEEVGGLPFAQQTMAWCLPRHRTPLPPPLLFIHDADDRHIALAGTRALVAQLAAQAGAPARSELQCNMPVWQPHLYVTTGLGHFHILKDPGVIAHIVAFLAERASQE